MLETPELYQDIGNVLHLTLSGLVRTHCEAVVEGMGSVLGLHSQNRTRTACKTAEREAIIRWQAPHPAGQATELIGAALDNHFGSRDKWHFCVPGTKPSIT
jgi:hypothetical protein